MEVGWCLTNGITDSEKQHSLSLWVLDNSLPEHFAILHRNRNIFLFPHTFPHSATNLYSHIFGSFRRPLFLHRWWMGWDGYIWVGWGTETLNIANETVNFGFDFKWWRFLLEWCFCLVYPTLQIVWRIRENVGTTKLHPVLNQAPPTQIKLIQKNWNRMKYCVLFCEGTYCWSYA